LERIRDEEGEIVFDIACFEVREARKGVEMVMG